MITPVNGHLVIEPLKHETFMASTGRYEEIGVIVAVGDDIEGYIKYNPDGSGYKPKVGDKVYFDAWLASKYPKNDEDYYWLVNWSDVRAIEHAQPE